MAEVIIDVMNTETVARRIGELAGEFGVSIRFICMEQMKLFARDVIRRTGGDGKISVSKQLAFGKKRIASDLNNIFEDDSDTASDIEMNISGRHLIKTTSGASYVVQPEFYAKSMGLSQMEAIHKSRRNKKGRTKALPPEKLGSLTSLNKYYVEKRKYKEYIKLVQKRAGRAKAGWVRALQTLEQKTGGKQVSGIPLSVRKLQSIAPQSGLIDNRSDKNVMLRADNLVEYAGNLITNVSIRNLSYTREKDLFGAMAKRMDQVVDRYNKTKG